MKPNASPENVLLFRELAAMYRCDLNLIVSTFEMELLTEYYKFPKSKLLLSPFYFDCSNERFSNTAEFDERNNFVMIGNFIHEPNVDAVKV